jgi:hypothetical protein
MKEKRSTKPTALNTLIKFHMESCVIAVGDCSEPGLDPSS